MKSGDIIKYHIFSQSVDMVGDVAGFKTDLKPVIHR
jgi:hypothetical protein